jgi:hypothetical protein
MTFNGDTTATNYRTHYMYGNGTAAASTTAANIIYLPVSSGGTNGGSFILDILDYSLTTKNKTTRDLEGWDANGSGTVNLASGVWLSNSAITSITLSNGTLTATQYSKFSLYGVKA